MYSGKIEGDYVVGESFELAGMVTGTVTVTNGGRFLLNGMVCKNLLVEVGGSVTLNGTVAGNVHNCGGKLVIYGTITGSLYKHSGVTHIDPKAVIRGGILESE